MQGSDEVDVCGRYQQTMLELWYAFDRGGLKAGALAERAAAVDLAVQALWSRATTGEGVAEERLRRGIALVAVGGYGRRQLFPHSDIDLMFLLDAKVVEKEAKDAIRRVSQAMWDCGMRVSPLTRRITECERFDPENAEFTLALMDQRMVAGDAGVGRRLAEEVLPKLLGKEHQAISTRLVEMTRVRHAKYGGTLFHLEPNVKDCPGGLRDVHVCGWLKTLRAVGARTHRKGAETAGEGMGFGEEGGAGADTVEDREFGEAAEFLMLVRSFLHYRHERDDNTLDWQAQDRAAEMAVGLPADAGGARKVDAAYWMRVYFRHARSVERRASQRRVEAQTTARSAGRLRALRTGWKAGKGGGATRLGYGVESGTIVLNAAAGAEGDPATDPSVVLELFAEMARTELQLGLEAETRISQGLPVLSANLEEGPTLWNGLRRILTGERAGAALRSMHALGLLDLLIPEFHGIDALVIRDAYHRYTVDEHTFVLIDTLHGLETPQAGGVGEWAGRFAPVLRDLPHADVLYLAALLHDTGKGRSTGDHTVESARMAESVLARLELEPYEAGMVLSLIRNHLEMSSALRRDIFDAETIRTFAGKVGTPEALRMLTLFTYADLNAVHPDALTPWKAENLWRLYIATSNYLDRSVDEERVGRRETELVDRVASTLPDRAAEVAAFLEGFPERYVRTRTTEQVRTHFLMAQRFGEDVVQLHFRYAQGVSELTLVTKDRPQLFATMAGVLAAWGMNIVTADAFSNRQGVVVDSFRFTDEFKTLEMNESERGRFVESAHDVVAGSASLEKLMSGRKRGRRKAAKVQREPVISFNEEASSQSTLLEVSAEDTPGLLRALSLTLAARGCNIEVALVDTEGEVAIDVFYVTRDGAKLEKGERAELRQALTEAIAENAS
ncbi:MAG: [protein-PII] uridylyltransferase [Acidobacteriaceae bacterium]